MPTTRLAFSLAVPNPIQAARPPCQDEGYWVSWAYAHVSTSGLVEDVKTPRCGEHLVLLCRIAANIWSYSVEVQLRRHLY